MDVELVALGLSPRVVSHELRGALWAFIVSLPEASSVGQLARSLIRHGNVDTASLARERGVEPQQLAGQLRELARLAFAWPRGGRGRRAIWIESAQSLSIDSLHELELVLRGHLGDGEVDAIDRMTERVTTSAPIPRGRNREPRSGRYDAQRLKQPAPAPKRLCLLEVRRPLSHFLHNLVLRSGSMSTPLLAEGLSPAGDAETEVWCSIDLEQMVSEEMRFQHIPWIERKVQIRRSKPKGIAAANYRVVTQKHPNAKRTSIILKLCAPDGKYASAEITQTSGATDLLEGDKLPSDWEALEVVLQIFD